jgi:hypothetical protein
MARNFVVRKEIRRIFSYLQKILRLQKFPSKLASENVENPVLGNGKSEKFLRDDLKPPVPSTLNTFR